MFSYILYQRLYQNTTYGPDDNLWSSCFFFIVIFYETPVFALLHQMELMFFIKAFHGTNVYSQFHPAFRGNKFFPKFKTFRISKPPSLSYSGLLISSVADMLISQQFFFSISPFLTSPKFLCEALFSNSSIRCLKTRLYGSDDRKFESWFDFFEV